MKKYNYFVLTILLALTLPTSAGTKVEHQEASVLCDFFGIGCPVSTSAGGGDGKEPPKTGG